MNWGRGGCWAGGDLAGYPRRSAGLTEVARGGDGVQVLFFSGCSGVIREVSLSGRGVRRCSGLFGFVRICSGLFRFVRSVLEWSAGMAEGLTVASFWQPLSTPVNLASTSVKFWQALARLGSCLRRNDGRGARRRCGERGMVRHSCSVVSVAGVGGSGVCGGKFGRVPACAGMTERGAGMTEGARE